MIQRTRWLQVIAVVAVLAMVLGACGPKATPAAPAPTEAPKAEPTNAPEAAPTTAPEAAPTAAPAAGAAWDNTPAANDKLVRSLDPKAPPAGWKVPAVVGHVTNYLMHEWYQNETKGEEARAKDWNEKFSINDANLDLQKSLAAVDDYAAKKTDAIVFTPVVDEASAPTIKKAVAAGMPIICEGNPTSGCLTMVAIDDYMAGVQVGKWAGDYIKQNMGGKANVLDISIPALKAGVNRSKGFTDGLKSIIPDAQFTQVDGKGLKDEAIKVAADALTANPDTNVIFGINDDSALGGLQSYTAAGMDPNNLLVVGFGCEGKACKNALMEGGPYKVSAAMFPEYQGRLLMDTLVAAYNGVKLPDHVVAPTLPVTKDNLSQFYTKDGDNWVPNFEATSKLPYGDVLRQQLNWTQQP
jgi:ribose transport system substrate-binding protein